MAAEIGHEPVQRRVVMAVEQRLEAARALHIALQVLAPRRAALEGQRGIERVRAVVDPAAQRLARWPLERGFEQLAVFDVDDLPADRLEELADALEQIVVHHAVEALAVVVDDPPEIPHVMLPALEQRLEDIALVELGVAQDRDHATRRRGIAQAMEADVILHQRREQGDADAEADRAGREIDVVPVLGARRIGLRAAQCAEALELIAALIAEQVLDGVEDRRGVRLDRDAVFGLERLHVERGHQGRDRGRGRLMAADLEPVARRAQMVGVVDGPASQPQHLALDLGQEVERVRRDEIRGRRAAERHGLSGHRGVPRVGIFATICQNGADFVAFLPI